jgi:hypothetical protein
MHILAETSGVKQCPSWCSADLGGEVHISAEHVIDTESDGERGRVYVSVEQAPGTFAAVRLSGAYDRQMSPVQALEIAHALTLAAFAAVTQ